MPIYIRFLLFISIGFYNFGVQADDYNEHTLIYQVCGNSSTGYNGMGPEEWAQCVDGIRQKSATQTPRSAESPPVAASPCPAGTERDQNGKCSAPSSDPSQKPLSPGNPNAKAGGTEGTAPGNEGKPDSTADSVPAPMSESELSKQSEADIQACTAQFDTAARCCLNPMKCVTGSQTAADGIGIAMMVGQAYGGSQMMDAQATNNPGKMQEICNAMKLGSLGTAAANAALGGVCSEKHNTCENVCEEKISAWKAKAGSYPATMKAKINSTIAQLTSKKNQCGGLANQASAMVMQGAQTGLAAYMFDKCKQLTAQSTGFENINTNRGVNCADPAYVNTVYCANCATNPTNPYCQSNPTTGMNNGALGSISTRSVNSNDSQAFNVDTVGDGNRQLNAGGGDTPTAKAQTFANNSGGSIPGGAAGPLGAGDNGKNQGTPGKPSADILQGERSGGGYSGGGFGGGSDGGFAGYGNGGGGGGGSSAFKGFDLKKYLPGNEKDPAARRIAAVGDPSKVINGKHGNIFADLSRRVILICAQDRLMDCDKTRTATVNNRN